MATVKLNGVVIEHRLHGALEKPRVVLIHGFPFDQSLWKGQLTALSRHFRVLTYDLRGMGKSGLGKAPQPLEAYVDDLFALTSHCGFSTMALCGLSMGGYIALRAVERDPARFWALALCDTKAGADSDEGKLGRAGGMKTIRHQGSAPFVKGMLPKLLAPATLARRGAVSKFLLKMMLKCPEDGMVNALSAMAGRSDTSAGLHNYQGPVLALCGKFDAIAPPAVAKSMAALARHGKAAVIPGAGHVSNLENPAAFNRALLSFLRKASGKEEGLQP